MDSTRMSRLTALNAAALLSASMNSSISAAVSRSAPITFHRIPRPFPDVLFLLALHCGLGMRLGDVGHAVDHRMGRGDRLLQGHDRNLAAGGIGHLLFHQL